MEFGVSLRIIRCALNFCEIFFHKSIGISISFVVISHMIGLVGINCRKGSSRFYFSTYSALNKCNLWFLWKYDAYFQKRGRGWLINGKLGICFFSKYFPWFLSFILKPLLLYLQLIWLKYGHFSTAWSEHLQYSDPSMQWLKDNFIWILITFCVYTSSILYILGQRVAPDNQAPPKKIFL